MSRSTLRLGFFLLAIASLGSQPVWAAAPAMPKSVLPFIEDDLGAAQARARETNRLLVVDAWAPWCHTCLSMRNFVFTDPLLRPLAERFVYLAVDTEQPKNADFVARYPVSSWPTLLVLDARGEVVARYAGAMTAAELSARLDEVARAQAAGQTQNLALAEADAAAAAKKWAAAAVLYAREVNRPELRGRARLGQIQALRGLGQYLACAELGDAAHAEVGRGATATDFFSYAADCLDRTTDFDAQARLRQRIRRSLEALVHDPRAPLSTDDRSDGYGTLITLADGLGDTAGGDRYAEERLQLLEAAAAQARTPIEAATFDAHRFECYRRLKRWNAAESMLLASERAQPEDYNPPARLARLYFETGQLDAALGRIDRALSLAAGPRRVSMLELKASIQHGLGQTRPAIATLEEALRIVEPKGALSAAAPSGRIVGLRKHIEALQHTLEPVAPAPGRSPFGPGRRSAPKVARRDQ